MIINSTSLQGRVIKKISDTHVSEGSGGQEPDMDFLCGYLTFYLAILGGYCIQYIRTHFRTAYSTDDNTVQSVLNPVYGALKIELYPKFGVIFGGTGVSIGYTTFLLSRGRGSWGARGVL